MILTDTDNNFGLKSIQSGLTTIIGGTYFANVAISSVNTNKSCASYLGGTYDSSYNFSRPILVCLQSANTVQIHVNHNPNYINFIVSWQVVEYL